MGHPTILEATLRRSPRLLRSIDEYECRTVAVTGGPLGQPAAASPRPRPGLAYHGNMERERRLRATYDAFNARDIEAVLRQMADDVDWPNAWEGGRVYGHDGVRDYWTRQWAVIDPTVEPVVFTTRADGSIAVEVDQVVRRIDGTLVGQSRVIHVYTFRDDLVTRMDVEALTRKD